MTRLKFIENRGETVIVVLDETALWLKLRGEEKVMVSFKEVLDAETRRNLKKAFKNRSERESNEHVEARIKQYMEQEAETQISRDNILGGGAALPGV